ncbi:phBC6A51 family helix-turn-helix protein [Paenibacillus sp. AR247]|uniref:phBC6A51 family helix-turn-helix protein n=1 Tax=Paenibacillus sp. AR247 TaxID=1631599 RepID=UPI000CF9D173|nr:phBC6A51 family helix-turn-helix protein [Paenibacillus sp. AR247]PQP86186.1 hypothetical protein CPT76_31310 [Paenibacillus sp. AR247]
MKRKRRKYPLDSRHFIAVELIVSGDYGYGEIAEILGVNRRTLLRWRKRKDFDKELRKARGRRVEAIRKALGDRKRIKSSADIREYFTEIGFDVK